MHTVGRTLKKEEEHRDATPVARTDPPELASARNPLAQRHLPGQDSLATVQSQLDAAAKRLNLDPGIHKVLQQSERELTVSIPVLLDDGSIEVFTGYRFIRAPADRARAASATTRGWTWTKREPSRR